MQAFRSFKIDWRAKASVFRLLDSVPYGQRVYFGLQRHVTRTVPRRLHPTATAARWFVEHARILGQAGEEPLADVRLFEFGAGWDLFGNCVLWCLGVEHQNVYDLTRWARASQINVVLRHLRDDPPPGAIRRPETMLPTTGPFEPALRDAYGIEYHAPADAGATGLPDGALTACCTTSVLEHVPPEQIVRLLHEARRVLAPGSLMSHVIDYSDHYAHSDAAITPYNYLAFTDTQWRRFSPGIHYQNRLRHADYRPLFEATGFRVISDRAHLPADWPSLLARVPLADQFADRRHEELAPLLGHWVLERI